MRALRYRRAIFTVASTLVCKLGAGILVVSLLAATATGAAEGASRTCAVPGSKTIKRLGEIRIYSLDNQVDACSTRYGRHVFLYKRAVAHGSPTLLVAAQVNQTVLAAGFARPTYPAVFNAVLVSRNLRTGALLRRHTDSSCRGGSCDLIVTRLVTNPKGSFAWIDDREGPGSVAEYAVMKDDSTGVTQLDYELVGAYCDSPPNPPACSEQIDTSYLKAADGMVFWKGGSSGTLQSANFN